MNAFIRFPDGSRGIVLGTGDAIVGTGMFGPRTGCLTFFKPNCPGNFKDEVADSEIERAVVNLMFTSPEAVDGLIEMLLHVKSTMEKAK